MDKTTVIALAREAHGAMLASGRGMYLWHGDAYVGDVQDFCERFAALVAAHEREECAKVCQGRLGGAVQSNEWWSGFKEAMSQCAAAIRSRK